MLIDLRKVAPGDLPNEVFDEFVAGNSYGAEMVAALRAHLVQGADAAGAAKEHGANAQKFRMRLEVLWADIHRAGRINALLAPDLHRLEQVFALASNLAHAVDELRSKSGSR